MDSDHDVASSNDSGSEMLVTSDSTSFAGAFFPRARNFTVAGGKFQSIINNYHAAPLPSDFRTIPLGDINLERETPLVCRRQQRAIRRVYSAKIDGRTSSVTVAMYQGNGAREDWQRDIANYMSMRHPNITQLWGTASSGNMHAAIFNDELIPFRLFLDLYRNSHFATVYIYAYAKMDLSVARNYFHSTFQRWLNDQDCTFFIRRSTGLLCVDLTPSGLQLNRPPWFGGRPCQQGLQSLSALDMEGTIIDSLTVDQYHQICYSELAQSRLIPIPATVTVNLSAVSLCTLGHPPQNFVEMVAASRLEIWEAKWESNGSTLLSDGWTRVIASDAVDSTISLICRLVPHSTRMSWFGQANQIFCRHGISSNFEDYVLLHAIVFQLTISATAVNPPPKAYLFLCPPKDFKLDVPWSVRWPECPAYWSLDPSGAERLTPQDAADLGFPSLLPSSILAGRSWDARVYAGLRQFHQAKGFDPDTDDLVRHLDKGFFQLFNATNISAHIDDESYHDDEDDPNANITDGELLLEHAKDSVTSTSVVDRDPKPWTPLMQVQLTLILFLSLDWLYRRMC
ncbi:hypothetical protein C8R45DRAFT_1043829 [Mycena sanguinolenta]|nr:hypothetical protein C8R45DRAFT_1043829 [Mycena sanguinolenta]